MSQSKSKSDTQQVTPENRSGEQSSVKRRDMLKGMLLTGASAPLLLNAGCIEGGIADADSRFGFTPVGERPRFTTMVELTVNGEVRYAAIEHRTTLLDLLRKQFEITGPKRGCDRAECGACTVLKDGEAVYSCTVLAKETEGSEVLTPEGLGTPGDLSPLQEGFAEEMAMQCGFCNTGLMMAAHGLLNENPDPSRDEIRDRLSGNLCRCLNYERIFRSVEYAAAKIQQR